MLDTVFVWLLIALFAPLASAIFAGVFIRAKDKMFIGVICSALVILSTIASLALMELVSDNRLISVSLADFISTGFLDAKFSFLIDSVSAVMMVVVGIVSSVVHVYSIYYMWDDENFAKFFSFLGLFVFSMLVLVTSDNFLGLFIGWEGVGLCSWLLIGFWYDRSNYSWCANEAFIMNRIADLGMLLGIFLIYLSFGSLRYEVVFANAAGLEPEILTLIAALLFIGAMGKSAQFPFHTWLADAMAGPTPVSALIHAATMVTAGVYLVVRANSIFALAPEVSGFIVCLGAFVAVFAASMALVHNDLKKIIAYSTLSQLGYMFVAAGFGAYWIALFHLATHAFFKALLFLGAGNVMHAMKDDLNIQNMGGLYKFMRPTAILMCIGSLALCGFYPFAGFFSKDKILEAAWSADAYFIWALLFAGAAMTTFYSVRLIMLVFFGKAKYSHHPHEAKGFALIAMGVLAVPAVIAGFFEHDFAEFVLSILPGFKISIPHGVEVILIALTLAMISAVAIGTIWTYGKGKFSLNLKNCKFYKILIAQYFIPQIYERVIVRGYERLSEICAKCDGAIIDASVDLIARVAVKSGEGADRVSNSGDLSANLRWMVLGSFILLILAFAL
ncbi:NADH-quinone oxidoreductase subunit L [Campylobacter gracilis]|uniref:NADH dehydrogenase subunit L n=1 Tax=Campylobacter gracilis RM3268 TaxID=553220 RepID=C8PF36_9BACT|nr:NADH-quinone oxidoreductase subunit L [Campylobacter gracilis]AKT91788.1 NADH:quinone oxidoreductase I, membrane subunit L [Campylobacter gracilis]EEV18664.1 NADH dehydrogenase subunit L [Campylobacter gracilis RM3268]UEB46003.1 NADH-quinone oxidoreductase subunit L [Campylobacter gracilis]SUW77758.1 NADH dehydrogenase subunit L [Campylobacter gracilis]